jgi:hypothetical protein
MISRRVLAFAVLLATAGHPLAAQMPAPADTRGDLEELGSALEAALGRTTRVALVPAARSSAHAYRLKGYGAMLVLAPRALPLRRVWVQATVDPETEELHAVSRARRDLEQDLTAGRHPEARAEIEASLARLKETEAELRRRASAPRDRRRVLVDVDAGPITVPVIDLADLQRQMESQMAAQAEALHEMEVAQRDWTREGEEQMRAHLLLVEQQAEAFRVQAERAQRQAERAMRTRLAPAPPTPAAPEAPVPPEPPTGPLAPPAPIAPIAHLDGPAVVVEVPAAPDTPEAPDAPDAPEMSPPPPWRFWVDTPEAAVVTDVRDAETAVAAVRASLTAALESYRRPLTSLRPDEFVSIAVDVVSDRFLRPATARTLMLRVRARDLQERAAGRLSAADFRQRVEFEEN